MNRLPPVGTCAPKTRWKLVTDPDDRDALIKQGKYREDLPFWRIDGDQMWTLADEFNKWKVDSVSIGKRL